MGSALVIACLEIVHAIWLSADFCFQNKPFFLFSAIPPVSYSLDPVQTGCFAGSDLGPDCLQR